MPTTEFALGRTALAFGLRALGLGAGDVLLIPDFLCDVVWHGARHAGVEVATFPIDDAFVPDWDGVRAQARRHGARALLMVHYFGQPQDVDRYQEVCRSEGLRLIENNAHGHGGARAGQPLGTFGDAGFSSPRKFLGSPSGGVLYLPDGVAAPAAALAPAQAGGWKTALRTRLARAPRVKHRLRGVIDLFADWPDPHWYREMEQPDRTIDDLSHRLIATTDWAAMARRRRAAWTRWSAFARAHGLRPAFADVHPESCPWALPVYAANQQERDRWLRWGARRGRGLFSWPALPEPVIRDNGPALDRWRRLCCFSLDAG